MKPKEWKWRYAILVCNCLFVIGVYYCIDIPSSLQVDFVLSEEMRCHANQSLVTGACCDTCLGLGSRRYNMLYAIVYFTASVLSLPAGYVIDRIGNAVSAVLLIILISIGACLFALAGSPLLRYTSAMFPVMVMGRMMLGFANGPMGLVQERVIAHWFREDSVVAVSLLFVTRRSGTLLNFLVTANIAVYFGFTWSLWVGAFFCSFGIVVAMVMAYLDLHGTKQLDAESQKQMASRTIRISDITNIPKTYWIHVSMMGLYYCSFSTFLANATQYMQLRYGYTKVMASYVIATTFIGPIFFAPFVAILLKRIECNGLVATAVSILGIPIYLLLAFCPTIPPIILIVAICSFTTFDTIILWQVSIELLPPAVFGTGAGIGMFMIRCSVGFTNLAVGSIIEEQHDQGKTERIHAYQNALLLMTAASVLSVACGVLLNVLDIRNGDGVNKRFIKNKPEGISDTTELVVTDGLSKQYKSNDNRNGSIEKQR